MAHCVASPTSHGCVFYFVAFATRRAELINVQHSAEETWHRAMILPARHTHSRALVQQLLQVLAVPLTAVVLVLAEGPARVAKKI